jgi:hypothetical protein
MKVELVARRIDQYERVWNRALPNDEARWLKHVHNLENVDHADDDVEIMMRARLTTEQRIDPPAAV